MVANILYNISTSTFQHEYLPLRLIHINIILGCQSYIEHEIKVISQIQTHRVHGMTLVPGSPKICQEMHYLNI